MRKPLALLWSGGKDSAYALHCIQQQQKYSVCCLLSTLSGAYRRVSMHGLREEMLDRQAAATGICLHKVFVMGESNKDYNIALKSTSSATTQRRHQRLCNRRYFSGRCASLQRATSCRSRYACCFPLWGESTHQLAHRIIQEGFRARICCVQEALQAPTRCTIQRGTTQIASRRSGPLW